MQHQQQQHSVTHQQHRNHYNNGSSIVTTTASSLSEHHLTKSSNSSTASHHKKQRFEAYMMTGDLILNLSRTEQSAGLIGQTHAAKKVVDSLRNSPKQQRQNGSSRIAQRSAGHNGIVAAAANTVGFAPHAKGESSLSSPSFSDDELNDDDHDDGCEINGSGGNGTGSDSIHSIRKQQRSNVHGSGSGRHDDVVDCSNGGDRQYHTESNSAQRMNKAGNSATSSNQYSATNNGSSGGTVNDVHDAAAAADDDDCDGDDEDQSLGSSTAARSDNLGSPDAVNCFSVPTSPTSLTAPAVSGGSGAEMTSGRRHDTAISAPASPDVGASLPAVQTQQQQSEVVYRRAHNGTAGASGQVVGGAGVNRRNDAAGFRTSRSEDHLQHTQRDILGAAIPIDIDEDVNSSLNTLLDTRQDSEDSQSSSDRDRIVWTYNAPVHPNDVQHQQSTHHQSSSSSHSSSISSSPQRSDSPASPTSVSSSVMSSNSGSRIAATAMGNGSGIGGGGGAGAAGSSSSTTGNTISGGAGGNDSGTGGGYGGCGGGGGGGGGVGGNGDSGGGNPLQSLMCPRNNGDHSVSEAVSNISSPDYQDDDNLLSSKDITGMAISDASDSDSTILVSDAGQPHQKNQRHQQQQGDHKIVIQVRGVEQLLLGHDAELSDGGDDVAGAADDVPTQMMFGGGSDGRESSPPVSDDGSDVDSLHSYHYSPKAVDIPSAVRLAKRLYGLDGFKKSDVSRHLSKK